MFTLYYNIRTRAYYELFDGETVPEDEDEFINFMCEFLRYLLKWGTSIQHAKKSRIERKNFTDLDQVLEVFRREITDTVSELRKPETPDIVLGFRCIPGTLSHQPLTRRAKSSGQFSVIDKYHGAAL